MKTKKTITFFHLFILIIANLLIINDINATDRKGNFNSFYCFPTKFSTILYANSNIKIEGETKKLDVAFILNSSCKFYWSHNIKEKGEYVAVISYSADKPGSVLTYYNNQSPVTEQLPATFGAYDILKGWQFNCVRRELKEKVTLAQGIQEITITLNPFDKESRFIFYSLELIPVSAAKQVKSEIKRATAARPDTKWFTKMQYGVMFHWTAQSMPKTGKQKSYKDAVKDFDVGYWLDGWYQCFNKFPDFDFESFYKCSKAGNANRLLALNSWLYPTVSVWQDYWAGEVFSSSVSPKSSIIKEGPGLGLQFQALLALEGDWVHT